MSNRYFARALPFPMHGMTHEIAREGARWPVGHAATEHIAGIFAEALTQASAMAAASWENVTEDCRALTRGGA